MSESPEASVFVHEDGVDWRLDSQLETGIRAGLIDRLPALLGGEIGERIKKNNVRTVIRFESRELDGRVVFLKAYRTPGFRDRLRDRLFASRAANEWRVMRHCIESGIPTARPLGYGERRGGQGETAYFASEGIPDPVDWITYTEELRRGADGERVRREWLADLARLVRLAHDRGLHHRDLHTNNILVRATEGEKPEVRFIDLHSGRVTKLGARRRMEGLVKLTHALRRVSTRTDQLRILQAYNGSDPVPGLEGRSTFHRLAEGVERLERRRLRSRTRRCVVSSSAFRIDRTDEFRIHRRTEVPTAFLLAAIEKHRALVAEGGAALVKDGRTNRISRFELAGEDGPEPLCVKEFRERGAFDAVKRRVGYLRGARSWKGAYGLEVREVQTARGLGLMIPARSGSQYVVMRWMEGFDRLDRYVLDRFGGESPLSREQRLRLIDAVADL